MRTQKLFTLPLVGIVLVLALFHPGIRPNTPQANAPANNVVYAQKIDTEVWKSLQGSPDGLVMVLALLGEQADLLSLIHI